MSEKVYPMAIVGGGSAGVMSALRCVLNHDECILFPGNKDDKRKARATWVGRIDNIPGYHNYKFGITQPNAETIKWIKSSPHKEYLTYKANRGIRKINKRDDDLFELIDDQGEVFLSEYVVLCTGVMDVQPQVKGSIEKIFPYANAQVVDYCIRCDGHHILDKNVTVIGSDNNAAHVAIILFERYSPPSMKIISHINRAEFDEELWELLSLYEIEVIEDEIVDVLGDEKEALLDGYILKNNGEIRTDFSFISMGMIVYNSLGVELGTDIDERGFVVTNDFGESSIKNFYVAGDVRAGVRKQIYSAWDSAVDAIDNINLKLRKMRREELKSSSKKSKKLVG